MKSVHRPSSMTFGGLFNNDMAYSAEESSPVPCITESCCVCDEEFSSDTDLANHLVSHADEEVFKAGLLELEKKTPTKHPPVSSMPAISRTVSLKEPLKRTASQRSTSPEVWEIISDDSDDESSKNKKSAKLSNSFRLVSTPSKPAESLPVQNNQSNKLSANQSIKTPVNKTNRNNKLPINHSNVTPVNQTNRPPVVSQTNRLPAVKQTNGPPGNKSNKPSKQNINMQTYKCHTCSAEFKDINLLKEHVLTHEKEKEKSFTCHICKKAFLHKGSLRQHLLLHIGDKNHSCKVCNKKFTVKSVLRKHELEEHGMQQTAQLVQNRRQKST